MWKLLWFVHACHTKASFCLIMFIIMLDKLTSRWFDQICVAWTNGLRSYRRRSSLSHPCLWRFSCPWEVPLQLKSDGELWARTNPGCKISISAHSNKVVSSIPFQVDAFLIHFPPDQFICQIWELPPWQIILRLRRLQGQKTGAPV